MKKINWEKISVDAKIIIDDRIHAYFCKYIPEEDFIYYFPYGQTSWSQTSNLVKVRSEFVVLEELERLQYEARELMLTSCQTIVAANEPMLGEKFMPYGVVSDVKYDPAPVNLYSGWSASDWWVLKQKNKTGEPK